VYSASVRSQTSQLSQQPVHMYGSQEYAASHSQSTHAGHLQSWVHHSIALLQNCHCPTQAVTIVDSFKGFRISPSVSVSARCGRSQLAYTPDTLATSERLDEMACRASYWSSLPGNRRCEGIVVAEGDGTHGQGVYARVHCEAQRSSGWAKPMSGSKGTGRRSRSGRRHRWRVFKRRTR